MVVFGLAHEVTDPEAWDPWIFRGGLASVAFMLPGLYQVSEWIRAHFRTIFQGMLWAFTVWAVVLCSVNGFPSTYSAGLTFAVVGSATVFSLSDERTSKPLAYVLFTVLLIAFGLALSTSTDPEQILYLGCIGGCGASVYILASRQIQARHLLENNEHQFRAAAEFFEKALGSLPIQVAILDQDARHVYVNPTAVPDEGLRKWMVGRTPVEYAALRGLDPEPYGARQEWLLGVVRTKAETRYEETVVDRAGGTRHILRVASPVIDRTGKVVQVFAYGIDLTDRKRFEEELFRAKEHAEEMLRLKSALLSNMSHEIRTPLTGILGFANILAEEATGQTRDFASGIARSASRLHETLESVLELARLESGRCVVEPLPLDIVSEVEEMVRQMTPSAASKGLYVKAVHRQKFAIARAEAPSIGRILGNLIGNAVKFTTTGGVTVTTDVKSDFVEISVSDTGIGIGEEFLPHVFDAFYQESSGFSRTHEGVGLGLAITKGLVELLDGGIDVRSRKGEGSTFIVRIPRGDEAVESFSVDHAYS